jgi:hypothetical protein
MNLGCIRSMPDIEADPVADEAYSSGSETRHDETTTEAGQDDRPNGYHRIAQVFAAVPNLAILRRFGQLNALNLLYLQAELVQLEDDLHDYAKKDDASPDSERQTYRRAWARMRDGVTDPHARDKNRDQWQTLRQIRSVLKEYSESNVPPVRNFQLRC